MSRIRASETLLLFFFLVFRVLDAKRSSSGAEADVAPSRRRRHGRHRINLSRKSFIQKKADEESSPRHLGYHFLYKNPKLFGFKKPEEEEGKKKRAKESEE